MSTLPDPTMKSPLVCVPQDIGCKPTTTTTTTTTATTPTPTPIPANEPTTPVQTPPGEDQPPFFGRPVIPNDPAGGPVVVPNGPGGGPQRLVQIQHVSASAMATSHVDSHDDDLSSDDNMQDNSNTSSVHVTPNKSKQTRFMSRKTVIRAPSPGHAGIETSVLSCELALLNALSNDVEGSVDELDKEQWKTRIAQINQVVRMVQWEAQGLYGLP